MKFPLKETFEMISEIKLLGKSLLYRNVFPNEDLKKTIRRTEFSKLWTSDNSIIKYVNDNHIKVDLKWYCNLNVNI